MILDPNEGIELPSELRAGSLDPRPTSERYARQTAIGSAWDQRHLARSVVTLIGDTAEVCWAAHGLTCLGVGQIYVLATRRVELNERSPYEPASLGALMADELAISSSRVNPHVRVRALERSFHYVEQACGIPPSDVLVDCTGSSDSMRVSRAAAQAQQRPLIVSRVLANGWLLVAGDAIGDTSGAAETATPAWQRSPAAAQIAGGLIADAVLHQLLPRLPGTKHPHVRLPLEPCGRLVGRHRVLMVGAGALGTYLALALAAHGVDQLTIVDPDFAELSNISRQPLYVDALGLPKAITLANSISALFPMVQCRPIVCRFNSLVTRGSDLIASCVDNFQARLEMNQAAVRDRITLVNGGTSAFHGEACSYAPSQTACLQCRFDLATLAADEQIRRASCAQAPEGSVVISNMIVAGLMAREVLRALEPHRFGQPSPYVAQYTTDAARRLGERSPWPACTCHHGGDSWRSPIS